MFPVAVVTACVALLTSPLRAQTPAPGSPGDWVLTAAGSVAAVTVDLNGDGTTDRITRGPCGTTNCGFLIQAAQPPAGIAEIEASVLVVRSTRINGWPVLHSYAHLAANEGILDVWIFQAARYVSVASVRLEGPDAERFLAPLQHLPMGPPAP